MIDLEKLNDDHSKDFSFQLHLAPSNLPVELTKEYFLKLFTLLSQNIPETVGIEILNTVNKTIRSENHLKVFVTNKLANSIPFTNEVYYPNILDILHEFSIKSPEIFDDYLISQLPKLISNYPEKTLIIIANYLMNSQNISKSMIELLFSHSSSFSQFNLFRDYASLLVYLCSNYSTFLNENSSSCWKIISQQLQSKEKPIITSSYNALCNLYDLQSKLIIESEIPFKNISKHLLYQECEHSAISFLLRYVTFIENNQINDSLFTKKDKEKVIDSLLKISASNQKASLLLFSFAEDIECAKYFILTNSSWMKTGVPTIHDSVLLFSTIMKHKSLQPIISNKIEIVSLFDEMLKEKGTVNIEFLSIFIRRLTLSNELITELDKINFLTRYLTIVEEKKEKAKIWIHCFLLIYSIARFSYLPQLNDYAKAITDLLLSKNEDETVNKTAIIVATALAVYYECASIFKINKLHHYLKKVRSENGNNANAAKSFLKVMKKTFSTHDATV